MELWGGWCRGTVRLGVSRDARVVGGGGRGFLEGCLLAGRLGGRGGAHSVLWLLQPVVGW